MHVLFSAAVIACPLQTTYCPGSDSLILDTKTVHSKEDEAKLQSWTKVGILLNFWGVFQFTHTLPLPSPHKQHWTHISRIFSPVSTLYRVGGKENYKKISKRMHCFMITSVQTTSSPLRFLLRRGGGGGVCTQGIL